MQDPDDDITRLQQLASLGELAAGVTHEARNVLTAIVGFVQLAKQRSSDPQAAKRHLELIEREALRATEILEQFLQLTREQSEESSEELEIEQLVSEIASAASYQAGLRRAEIITHADVPRLRIAMRRAALLQVLLNLVLNALHAVPAAAGKVQIEASFRDGVLELVVADNGPGVTSCLREKIFVPFFTTKPKGEGTGLGLAVCRRLVESAGGTIVCEPSRDNGAAFVVRLPAEAV